MIQRTHLFSGSKMLTKQRQSIKTNGDSFFDHCRGDGDGYATFDRKEYDNANEEIERNVGTSKQNKIISAVPYSAALDV